jgi:hypothetical protein
MADVTETDYTTNPPTITERDFTEAELAQQAKDLENEELRKAEVQAKAEAKAAAEAKLVSLGLDLDDLRALGL